MLAPAMNLANNIPCECQLPGGVQLKCSTRQWDMTLLTDG